MFYFVYVMISSSVILVIKDLFKSFGFIVFYGGLFMSFVGVIFFLNNVFVFI